MILADYHTHTAFSDDSESTPESMAKRAVALGLKTLCITDHMDYLYPEKYAPTRFVFDADKYFAKLTALKETYEDRLELCIGVELGLRNEPALKEACADYYRKLCAHYPFDFIIGSTHVLEDLDPYYPEYWETHSKSQGMRAYYESILENIGIYDMFQVYGHLDYLVRYLPQEFDNWCRQTDYCFSDYEELISEILKKLIASGRGIEVNTSGTQKYGLPFAHPHPKVLKLYKNLGGEIITIGSDAHHPKYMAGGFASTRELLLSLGFSYYTVYRKREPVFLPL